MVDRPYLPLSIKASGMAAQERLALLAAGGASRKVALEYCILARRVGVGMLLSSGLPGEMFDYLRKSARAWLCHVESEDESQRVTGSLDPLLDAIAGGDDVVVARLRTLQVPLREAAEYEEEHLYARLLLELSVPEPDRDRVIADLDRYGELDGADPRNGALRALFERDQNALAESVATFAESEIESLEAAVAKGVYDPDHRATTGCISVDLIAWARLAEAMGVPWPERSPLCPPSARRFDLTGTPHPDGWRVFPVGGDLPVSSAAP